MDSPGRTTVLTSTKIVQWTCRVTTLFVTHRRTAQFAFSLIHWFFKAVGTYPPLTSKPSSNASKVSCSCCSTDVKLRLTSQLILIWDYVLQNVCQKQETELAQGFLSSPSYPLGSLSNNHCQCQLVPSSNHLIALEIIDFRLPPCSEAGLYLSIAEDHRPKCSNQNPITLLANYQQNVTLRFYTVSNFTQGGFLLKYSTLPLNSNGTIRLECHAIQALSRSLLTKYQITKSSASPLTEPILDLEQLEALMFSSTVNTDVNNSIHQSLKVKDQHFDILVWSISRWTFNSSRVFNKTVEQRPNNFSMSMDKISRAKVIDRSMKLARDFSLSLRKIRQERTRRSRWRPWLYWFSA